MNRSLRARIAVGLSAYTLLLATALIGIGYSVHESLEWMVWRAQLDGEMAAYLQQRAHGPNASLPQSRRLRTYVIAIDGLASASLPEVLRPLAPGVHDHLDVAGIQTVAMVRDLGSERIFMTLDISALENEESLIARVLITMSLLGAGALVLLVWWLSGRLVNPVRALAEAVDGWRPGVGSNTRLSVDGHSINEVQSIASAMNRMLDRVDELIEREREFVNTMSHELRTPLSVIAGASHLIEQQPNLSEAVRKPLQRITQSAVEVEQLTRLLLVLAKSPEQLRAHGEVVQLDRLLLDIVRDHSDLIGDKALSLSVADLSKQQLHASAALVRAAISNLLRNAIENSHRGVIEISIEPEGVVRIQDSGQGMSAVEISRVYSTLARSGDSGQGRGIGLALIARICAHLSWRLDVKTQTNSGTLAILDMRSSLLPQMETGGQ